MGIGYLDIILISLACLLIVASFVVNILSATRVSRLADSLGQLETSFEERLTVKKRRMETANKSDSDSKDKYMDSSILPAAEKTEKDPTTKIRYRPPSTTIIPPPADPSKPDKNVSVQGTITSEDDGGSDILIVKNKRDVGPVVITAANAASVKEEKKERKEDKAREIEKLDAAQKELLKNYLGKSDEPAEPLQGTDLKEIYEGGDGEAESEIMDVITDTHVGPPTERQDIPENRESAVDMDLVLSALDGAPAEEEVVLNLEGVSDISKNDLEALKDACRRAEERRVQVVLKNLPGHLKERIASHIPRAAFLP